MKILKVTFCTKIEKTKKCETLTHGDFDNIFEKKWKINNIFLKSIFWSYSMPKSA